MRITIGIYLVGLLGRVFYLFRVHPATDFVYSDMQGYHDRAMLLADPTFVETIADSLFPPGTSYFFSWLYRLDPSWMLAISAQCVLAAAIPLLIGAIAYELYGRRVALVAVVMASLYFPFVEHAAFFLSENPMLFCMLVAIWSLLRSMWAVQRWRIGVWGLAAGAMLGVAAAFKSLVLLPGLFIAGLVILRMGSRVLLLACSTALGLAMILAPLSHRCTRLNEGNFCLISTNGGMNVLLGHSGKVGTAHFEDAERGYYFHFGSPAALQHGYSLEPHFPFGAYDTPAALGAAWTWTRAHPREALELSLIHVRDLFWGSIPWPTSHTPARAWAERFQVVYGLAIFLPSMLWLVWRRSAFCTLRGAGFAERLLIAPLVALMIVTFCTIGGPRFRIPFDSLQIILASSFYLHIWNRLWQRRGP